MTIKRLADKLRQGKADSDRNKTFAPSYNYCNFQSSRYKHYFKEMILCVPFEVKAGCLYVKSVQNIHEYHQL